MGEANATVTSVAADAGLLAEEAAQVAELVAARFCLLELFHKCFGGEPNEALLEALTSQDVRDAVALYADDDATMAGFAQLLKRLAQTDAAAALDRMHDEYTRVFEGPGALPAPPYRAPYTGSRDAALFQEATLEVRSLFHAQGLRVTREQAFPDDHVALLLDFAAHGAAGLWKCFAASDPSFAEEARKQHEVISGYLADWLPEYARLVRNSQVGQTAYLYPQLLEACAAFAALDCVFLGEAAWWFEQNAEAVGFASCVSGAATDGLAGRLASAHGKLQGIRLKGLEDNELTVFDRLEG